MLTRLFHLMFPKCSNPTFSLPVLFQINNVATQQAVSDDGEHGANSILTHQLSLESWHRMIDVNLTSVSHVCNAFFNRECQGVLMIR